MNLELRQIAAFAAIVAIAMLTLPTVGFASEDWLIGYWEGSVKGTPFASDQSREFRVREVRSDGTFDAWWAIHGYVASHATGRVDNGTVVFRLLNGRGDGTEMILVRQTDILIGTINPVSLPASQIVLHKTSNRWNETTAQNGCDYQSFSRMGDPMGIGHLAEGESNFGRFTSIICKNGFLEQVVP